MNLVHKSLLPRVLFFHFFFFFIGHNPFDWKKATVTISKRNCCDSSANNLNQIHLITTGPITTPSTTLRANQNSQPYLAAGSKRGKTAFANHSYFLVSELIGRENSLLRFVLCCDSVLNQLQANLRHGVSMYVQVQTFGSFGLSSFFLSFVIRPPNRRCQT